MTGKHFPLYYVDAARWAALRARITAKPADGAADGAADKLYRVQIGAFRSRQNAENYLAKAQADGYDGFVVEVEG